MDFPGVSKGKISSKEKQYLKKIKKEEKLRKREEDSSGLEVKTMRDAVHSSATEEKESKQEQAVFNDAEERKKVLIEEKKEKKNSEEVNSLQEEVSALQGKIKDAELQSIKRSKKLQDDLDKKEQENEELKEKIKELKKQKRDKIKVIKEFLSQAGIKERKEDFEKRSSLLLQEKEESNQRYREISLKERRTEERIIQAEEKEKGEKVLDKKREIEMERQELTQERNKTEKERWQIEDQIKDIDDELSSLEGDYRKLSLATKRLEKLEMQGTILKRRQQELEKEWEAFLEEIKSLLGDEKLKESAESIIAGTSGKEEDLLSAEEREIKELEEKIAREKEDSEKEEEEEEEEEEEKEVASEEKKILEKEHKLNIQKTSERNQPKSDLGASSVLDSAQKFKDSLGERETQKKEVLAREEQSKEEIRENILSAKVKTMKGDIKIISGGGKIKRENDVKKIEERKGELVAKEREGELKKRRKAAKKMIILEAKRIKEGEKRKEKELSIKKKEEAISKKDKEKEERKKIEERKRGEGKREKEEKRKKLKEEKIKQKDLEKEAKERQRQGIAKKEEGNIDLNPKEAKEKSTISHTLSSEKKRIGREELLGVDSGEKISLADKKQANPVFGLMFFLLLFSVVSGLVFSIIRLGTEPAFPEDPDFPEIAKASLPAPPKEPIYHHVECRNMKCVKVEGKGKDDCEKNKDCFHKECRGKKCVAVAGGGVDLCTKDSICKPVIPPIEIGTTEEIIVSSLNSDVFLPLLDKKFNKKYESGTFIEIIPKYKGELLTISQLFKLLDLHPPKNVKDNLEHYTLFLYAQEELISQKKPNRLGIAFKIKKGKSGIVRMAMAKWEKVLPDDFYEVHTLWQRGPKASSNFLDNTYRGIAIRYSNFPEPDLSIDWAIANDVLILTTSRESIWETIDLMKK